MPSSECFTRGFRVFIPVSISLLAAGCSADVSRFDFPGSASFADNQTNSIPIPPATVHSPPPRAGLLGDQGAEPMAPPPDQYGARPADVQAADVQVAELPRASGDTLPPSRGPIARDYDRGYQTTPVRAYDAAPQRRMEPRAEQVTPGRESGEVVEVRQGDTLYGLSRRHGVPVEKLMSANDLQGHSLKPGQRLTIPSGRDGAQAAIHKPAATPEPIADAPLAQAPPVTTGADALGTTYTMKAGDSLYEVARRHHVKYADLQQHNGITDVRKIRPGTVLKIPGANAGPSTPAQSEVAAAPKAPATATPGASEAVTTAPAPSHAEASPPADGPKLLNPSSPPAAPPSTAASEPVTTPPAAPSEPGKIIAAVDPVAKTGQADKPTGEKTGVRLRWPVQGKVISGYGARADGTHNDGVNLSVPLGTDVHAAEDGEVIYVGDDLKAYGKLVLVRHDNGWVTAYAHNDDISVKRGDKVARGQVVAKAGKTGPVDQPQVHFELRQDSKAVDPTAFMEKL